MTSTERDGLVAGMGDADRAAVEQLLASVDAADSSEHAIYLEPAGTASQTRHFQWFDHGRLVGFAVVYDDGETSGVVDPAYRRRGIGRALLDAVRAECRQRNLPVCLLALDELVGAGRAFVEAVGGRYQIGEYRMVLDPAAIDRSRPRHADLVLQDAGAADAATLIRLQALAFDDPEDEVRHRVEHGLQLSDRRYHIGVLNGEPIGVLRIGRYGPCADVTAFGVLPAYRGRGYGRQMLLDAVDILLPEQWPEILIEVETENRNALGLYQSCGFRERTTYGYYAVDV